MSKWNDIVEGYGLIVVPSSVCRDMVCCHGGPHTGRETLYTDQPLPSSSSANAYGREKERLRTRCWCRAHATYLFEDKE
jgi:hypothetical protein